MNKTTALLVASGLALYLLNRTLSSWSIPSKGLPFSTLFASAEMLYGLPRNLLARMAQQESGFNPTARGKAGEIGIMQIIPAYHPGVNPYSVEDSIDYAGQIMAGYYARYGKWTLAIAAYNAGLSAVDAYLHGKDLPRSTINYINNVLNDIGVVS